MISGRGGADGAPARRPQETDIRYICTAADVFSMLAVWLYRWQWRSKSG